VKPHPKLDNINKKLMQLVNDSGIEPESLSLSLTDNVESYNPSYRNQ
jgi:hypothetical protein